ncbi:MAG: LCP family protein [Anaerolineae bacterium]|nr:LCP family protein [Anaerolineae bacterium]
MWIVPQSRVNTLILGIDRRPGQGYVVRTDTIVLATIDSRSPSVGLLSVPRDLYVDIPGYGANRINTAHFWGENESAGNGPGLAMATVVANFGIPVHHYLRIDFDGFRAIIDAVGGIDIMVDKAIVDDAYPTSDYGTIHIEISEGLQHLDGETALQYARSRHGSSDFSRAKRQQQILIALAERLIEPQTWLKLPAVYGEFTEHVDTDLTIVQMLSLAPTVLRVGPEGIEHRVIDQEMTQPWTKPTGGAVLLPQWELINPAVRELFGP